MKIAIVGAGRGGTNLIKVFKTLSDIEVVIVIDTNSNAEGVQYAKQNGISWGSDLSDIGKYHPDVIVEATGVGAVIGTLRDLYGQRTQIIDAQVAQVLIKMVDGQVTLLDQMSHQMKMIHRLASTFKDEFSQLVTSVDNINQLSKHLNLAVEQSNNYIVKTGEITNSVNKIAMQTKILGLNANIEAARAGEHGKGFAVVANEVQKLSDSSTQFATEISDLLKELFVEIQKVNSAANELITVSTKQRATAEVMENAISELSEVM